MGEATATDVKTVRSIEDVRAARKALDAEEARLKILAYQQDTMRPQIEKRRERMLAEEALLEAEIHRLDAVLQTIFANEVLAESPDPMVRDFRTRKAPVRKPKAAAPETLNKTATEPSGIRGLAES